MSQTGDYECLFNPQRKRQSFQDAAAASISDEFPSPLNPATPIRETKEKKEPKQPSALGAVDGWKFSHGHKLTFVALFIFSIILYFRPYELVPALSSFGRWRSSSAC